MNIAIIVLSVIGGIFVLLLVIAAFSKKSYKTHSEILIDAPQPIVFDYLKHIRNQDNYNLWVMTDPKMKKSFTGTDGTVGFIYAWDGNKKAGAGEQEIKSISEAKSIDTEIRFVRPIAGIAYAKMMAEPVQDNQTRVTWTTGSEMKYPLNIMLPMIVNLLQKDMFASLTTLKGIMEK